ncbi:MAG TPA: acetyl-CoA carboxylase biotin carboxyl carrier protein [Vicinamibacterales bacterium]|jgi:acetyl-CoA carboxylase biotin carboxyl carrier protein
MDLNQLKELLELVRQHELSEFEIEHDGLRLKVRRNGVGSVELHHVPAASGAAQPHAGPGPQSVAAAPVAVASAAAPTVDAAADAEVELAVVKSPIVGTFYRSPEPGADSFVEVGASVKKGQVLCIIEAMKLMNEIDSEYDGEIVNIYVESGQAVQYGERLFAIRTR